VARASRRASIVITSATETTITAAPPSIPTVIVSERTSAPSAMATTGFT
jgi:hypothetical protein